MAPQAKIDGLDHGMGFILWLKEGYAQCLEEYFYGESTTELVFETFGFDLSPDPSQPFEET